MHFVALAVTIGIAFAGLVSADENAGAGWAEENLRVVQMKLHEAVCTSVISTVRTAANWPRRSAVIRFGMASRLPGSSTRRRASHWTLNRRWRQRQQIARGVPKRGEGCA